MSGSWRAGRYRNRAAIHSLPRHFPEIAGTENKGLAAFSENGHCLREVGTEAPFRVSEIRDRHHLRCGQGHGASVTSASEIQSAYLAELFDYWTALRGDRSFPTRREIDPTQLPPRLLPHMFLADVVGEGSDFRFRLAGTEVVTHAGLELTGRLLSELPLEGLNPIIAEYQAAVNRCEPRYSASRYISSEGYTRTVERLVLPLSREGGIVDMLTGAFAYWRNATDSEPAI